MLEALTDALATFRLTRLVVDDRISAKLRNAAVKRFGQEGLGYLVGCPWCSSIWIGAGVVVARRVAPKAWAPVAELLALSAVSGLVAEHA